MSTKQALEALWSAYAIRKDSITLREYLVEFRKQHSACLNVDLSVKRSAKCRDSPHLIDLPDGFLQAVEEYLRECSDDCNTGITEIIVNKAVIAIDVLSILARNFNNIPFVSTSEVVPYVIAIASAVANQFSEHSGDAKDKEVVQFLHSLLFFLEVLYDPYFLWRETCSKNKMNLLKPSVEPSHLHLEIIPFFYDCLSTNPCYLPSSVQMKLLHVFGAILCGAQHNAQVAINQNTVDILFQRLSDEKCFLEVKMLSIKCIIQVILTLCAYTADRRKIQVNHLVSEFLERVSTLMTTEEQLQQLDVTVWMIDCLRELLSQEGNVSLKKVFHDEGLVEKLIRSLHRTKLKCSSAQKLAGSLIRLINVFLSNCNFAKKHFISMQGFKTLCRTVYSLGEPQEDTIETLLEWAVEEIPRKPQAPLKNIEVLTLLLQWLPDIKTPSLQVWTSEQIYDLCDSTLRSKIACCRAGMITTLLQTMEQSSYIKGKAMGSLLRLFLSLGSCSITSTELKQLFLLLRINSSGEQHSYTVPLIYVLSCMAKRDGWFGASHFFDFQGDEDGIAIPAIKKWPGSGFTFHAWVRLDKQEPSKCSVRRQLYSFMNGSGSGLEAFFTNEGKLIVAVLTKKEYYAVPVEDSVLDDGNWHCVDICHTPARRPFTHSMLTVHIDSRQKLNVQAKFPSLSEPFVHCRIAMGGHQISIRRHSDAGASKEEGFLRGGTLGTFFGGWDTEKLLSLAPNLTMPTNLKSAFQSEPDPNVAACPMGSQDQFWGIPTGLRGHIRSVCLFSEALLATQVKTMFSGGPKSSILLKNDESAETADLLGKLVFYYDAKASAEGICVDLSPNQQYDGQVSGQLCSTYDVRDVINCIGGYPVLFLLLENAGKPRLEHSPSFEGVSPSPSRSGIEDVNDDWIIVPSISSFSDWRLAQNQVAGFILIVVHMMQGHQDNQAQLITRSGIPTIGALMQRVPDNCIDVNVLMAVQLLVENASSCENSSELLRLIYQYILFDFRIWSKGNFAVRIGHIQYLSTIIKENRKYFKKKYGVQFLLDVIHMFYNDSDLLSSEDVKTIRMAVLGLVKFNMSREVNVQDVSAILNYMLSQKIEENVLEATDILLSLVEGPTTSDQLCLLLYEPNCSELLYCLLQNPDFTSELRIKVLKLIHALLKTEKVYEKSKARLRLQEVGFSSLMSLLSPQQVSPVMAKLLVTQILLTDTPHSHQGLMALLNFMKNMTVDVKLFAAEKILTLVNDRPLVVRSIAKQIGWQECILGLLIKQHISESRATSVSLPSMDLIDFTAIENAADASDNSLCAGDAENIKPGSPSLRRGTFHRLSQKALVAQQSLEEILPGSPRASQLFTQLKEHIFDFELTQFLGRSHSNSQCSSSEDLTTTQGETNVAPHHSSPNVTPFQSRKSDAGMLSASWSASSKSCLSSPVEGNHEVLLVNTIVDIITKVMWRGIDGSGKQVWAERGQVLVCINKLALTNDLYFSHLEIKRLIYEKLLNMCCTDLQDAGQVSAVHTENAAELMKFVYDFVVQENIDDDRRISEKLLENILCLLDVLMVFAETPGEEGWDEMATMGLSVISVCAGSKKLELCAMATAKLHALVQTRPFATVEEACYLLAEINKALAKAVEEGDHDHYSFIIPVVRALLDKIETPLNTTHNLPNLPSTASGPAFFEEFEQYTLTTEWKSFITSSVKPLEQKYSSFCEGEQHEAMNLFWNQCYESVMVAMHKRNRETGESKLRFQSQILSAFQTRVAEEQSRIIAVQTNMKNQHLFIRRHWRKLKLFLTGSRGPWASRNIQPLHWKLSQQENFARMRLKLILNHSYDNHRQASYLRDNQGASMVQNSASIPSISLEARAMQQQEDSLAEEDLKFLQSGTSHEVESPDTVDKEKTVIAEDCDLVTLMKVVKGRFEVTLTQMYFIDLSPVKEEGERPDFRYPLYLLREVHLRRYNLRRSALEFFLIDQTNFFLNFTTKTRNKIYSRIVALRPPNLLYSFGTRTPAELLKASGLTQKWIQREVSNFEYLMHLNTISGRTYNDLSQYPVFPWILADYTSEELDLENPSSYRDLSKPIGVVNPKNIPEVKAKYEHFVDITGTVEKFHYGTHYSNSAGVLHYLVRLEPFTSLHIDLQSGRFDVADRQFHSIIATWRMLMESPNDVKELIPEFFYLPEFLININGFDLGRLQSSRENVDHVHLPTWAHSPEEFIYLHRKALESEFVSAHLHEWIDLIFGHKQKGQAAVEALNVFYYVSYEGAVDLDAIKDPVQREATEGIINNFGQTPCQLLKEQHPRRMSFEEAMLKMTKSDIKPPSLFLFLKNLKAYVIEAPMTCPIMYLCVPKLPARSFMQHGLMDTLVTVGQNGILGIHGWLPYDRTRAYPNYFTFDKDPSLNNTKNAKKIAGPFMPAMNINTHLFVISHDAKFLISGGHWDNSVRVYSLVKYKQVAQVILHQDIVTCLALDQCNLYLMSGSRDTTCIIWELMQQGAQINTFLPNKPFQVLCGHSSEVTCVALATELDMAISGSKDGTVNIHSIREGQFLHTLHIPSESPESEEVSLLSLSDLGFICVYGRPRSCTRLKTAHSLHLFTINGKHLLKQEIASSVSDMFVNGDHLVTSDCDGALIIWELFRLQPITSVALCAPILAIASTPGNSHILCSLQDGKIIVVGISLLSSYK